MRRRRGCAFVLIVGVVGVIVWMVILFRSRAPRLLDCATPIITTEGWELPNGTDAQIYMTYYWPSNDQALFFTLEDELTRYDLKTHQQIALKKISKMLFAEG